MKKLITLLFLVTILLSLNFNLAFSAKSDLNNTSEEIIEQTIGDLDEVADEDFDISSLEYDETNFEDDILSEEDDELFQENRLRSVILFIFCLICIIAYIVFMKKEKDKEKKKSSKSSNAEVVVENNETNKFRTLLYAVSVAFVILLLIFCFIASMIDKNLADGFITVMLGALMYTLLVLIRNEKNLTNIINKSIKIHEKGDATKKPTKANRDFTFVAIDFLMIISSIVLIIVFLFMALSDLADGDIISATILVLLATFVAMLLHFWILIQHNNKISTNIKQNKLKNIYKKSGVHLKFDNSKIKIKKRKKKK